MGGRCSSPTRALKKSNSIHGSINAPAPICGAEVSFAKENSMKSSFRRMLFAVAFAVPTLIVPGRATAQQTVDKPLLAEQVFKNIRALRGIPVDDFMQTMGIMT